MHLPGGPSTGETFTRALGFQVRKRMEAKTFGFSPENNTIPTELHVF